MSPNMSSEIPRWWSSRRGRYNTGLAIAVVIAVALYFILGREMIVEFEVTTRAVLMKLLYGLVFIGIANVFYLIGAMIDTRLNWGGIERVSRLIWGIVFWSSVACPFIMPALILADRYDLYSPLGL